MTLRHYCEQMGLRLVCDLTTDGGFRCSIKDVRLDDSCGKAEAAAEGPSNRAAQRALAQFISGRLLRSTIRETTLYWVPPLETR
jgi:hypothetical protein